MSIILSGIFFPGMYIFCASLQITNAPGDRRTVQYGASEASHKRNPRYAYDVDGFKHKNIIRKCIYRYSIKRFYSINISIFVKIFPHIFLYADVIKIDWHADLAILHCNKLEQLLHRLSAAAKYSSIDCFENLLVLHVVLIADSIKKIT